MSMRLKKVCQVQYNRSKSKLEVVLKHYTKIQRSPVQFDIQDLKTVGSPLIPLSDLGKHQEYDRVTVRVKVIRSNDPQTVGNGKTKQDVIIADATAKSTLVLWESKVQTLVNHKSYQLNRVLVRVFMGKHHLTLPPTGSTVAEVSDVENLHVDTDSSEEEDESVMGATVTGVQTLDRNFSCMNCKKTVEPKNDFIGTCTLCNTQQKLTHANVSAKIFIQSNKDTPIAVRANAAALLGITGKDPALITAEDILFAPTFTVT